MFPGRNVDLLSRSLALQSRAQAPANCGERHVDIGTAALGLLSLCCALCFCSRDAAAEENELFACTFPNTSLAKPWKTIGGTWQVQQGVLKQLDAGLDDPSKAVLILGDAEEMSSGIEVTAKLRLDTWKGDDQARAGVGLCCDPETGYGLNLAFNRGQLQFVHDYVTWAPGCAFSYQTGDVVLDETLQDAGRVARQSLARRPAGTGRLDGRVDRLRPVAHGLSGPARFVGWSGGRRIDGLLCRVSRGAHRPEPDGVLHETAHVAGDNGRQPRDARSRHGCSRFRSPDRQRTHRDALAADCGAISPIRNHGGKWPGSGRTASGRRTGRA